MEIEYVGQKRSQDLKVGDVFLLDCPDLDGYHDQLVETRICEPRNLDGSMGRVPAPAVFLNVRLLENNWRLAWSFKPNEKVTILKVLPEGYVSQEELSLAKELEDQQRRLAQEAEDEWLNEVVSSQEEPAPKSKLKLKVKKVK